MSHENKSNIKITFLLFPFWVVAQSQEIEAVSTEMHVIFQVALLEIINLGRDYWAAIVF